jgi:hypothetical protein
VIVQQDSELLRSIHSTLTDLGNKLSGLPESVVNGFREATGHATTQPPAQPPAQQTTVQSGQTTPPPAPPEEQGTGKVAPRYKPSRFAKWWLST